MRGLEVMAPLSLCKRQKSIVVRPPMLFKALVIVPAPVLAYWHSLLW